MLSWHACTLLIEPSSLSCNFDKLSHWQATVFLFLMIISFENRGSLSSFQSAEVVFHYCIDLLQYPAWHETKMFRTDTLAFSSGLWKRLKLYYEICYLNIFADVFLLRGRLDYRFSFFRRVKTTHNLILLSVFVLFFQEICEFHKIIRICWHKIIFTLLLAFP